MVRVETEQNRINEPVEYVFGAVQWPRGGRGSSLYFGWDAKGYPRLTTEGRMLTSRGRDMLSGNSLTPFPFDAGVSGYTPKVFEFAEMPQPIDNLDDGNRFTEDVVNIACFDETGAVKFIGVKELTLLDAVIRGQINWMIGGKESYSLMIPDAETNSLNIILFGPEGNPTNELSYRTFLLKTIRTLALIDRKQIPPDQKGYMDVLRAVIRDLNSKAASRDNTGAITKIATDLGILEESDASGSGRIAYLSVNQFRYVIEKYHEVVGQSFATGKV